MHHTLKFINTRHDENGTVSRVLLANDYQIEERKEFVSITIQRENKEPLWLHVGEPSFDKSLGLEYYESCYIENQDGKTIAAYRR